MEAIVRCNVDFQTQDVLQFQLKANQIQVTLGTKTRSEIIREDGRDPEAVFKELAEEEQTLGSRGQAAPGEAAAPASRDDEGDKRDAGQQDRPMRAAHSK